MSGSPDLSSIKRAVDENAARFAAGASSRPVLACGPAGRRPPGGGAWQYLVKNYALLPNSPCGRVACPS